MSVASLLLGLMLASATAAEKPVHVFILSGQSNMYRMKPEAGFVPEAAKLFPDAETAYIKLAWGGKPIRFWVRQWNEIAGKHDLAVRIGPGKRGGDGTAYYKPILEQYNALLEKHPEPASVTFCWMQGESDVFEKLTAAYGDALRQLIANLRRDLKQPSMNVVIGRLSDHRGDPKWMAVRAVQVEIAGQDPRGAWVDCDDLNDLEKKGKKINGLHYTGEGYALLGRRFARQAKALIEGRQPAADGRPE